MSRPRELSRRLAAFWFADIVGFTTLSARDELAALAAVEALRAHASELAEQAGGRLVKISGDAVLAEFPSSDAAIQSAIALRDLLASAEPMPIQLHIGVHLGEVSTADGDIYGDGVNTAARLQTSAGVGQVLASEDIYRRVRANPAFRFSHVGALELKGLPEPVHAYGVELAGTAVADGAEQGIAFPRGTPSTRGPGNGQPTGTRLIVLPFRMLRSDDEIEFLAFSLPDAIAFSLSKLQAIVVRSLSAGAQFAGQAADPREVARHTDVDLVVAGTLLRVRDRLQVTAELNDGRDGTLLGSYRTQADLGDLFELQETLTDRIVEALALPLTTRERTLMRRDVPATARAYELYLRANDMAYKRPDWENARQLYEASLKEDPTYAPAWARLGRCQRLIGKYGPPEILEEQFGLAEAAFKRAIALNPDLDLAHGYAASLDTDRGRCGDAMVRLLDRLLTRPQGVELLAGLVHALRYCGLLEESLTADRAARRIDPSARTSVAYTHFALGDYEAVLRTSHENDLYIHGTVYLILDRLDDARAVLNEARAGHSIIEQFLRPIAVMVEGGEMILDDVMRLYASFPDPEGRLQFARFLTRLDETERALDLFKGIAPQYAALPPPGHDPWLSKIDTTETYLELYEGAQQRTAAFRDTFRAHPASGQLQE